MYVAKLEKLSAESVERTSLAFQRVDDIHGGDSLALGVLGVGNGIADHVLKEHLQYSTCLLVDQSGDALDSTTTSQTTDRWFRDTLDVITQDLSVTLGASFSKSLSSFTTA